MSTHENKPSAAIPVADYYDAAPEVSVYSWSPAPPGTVNAKSTQVHLHIGSAPGPIFMVRLKSAAVLDELIASMVKHREDVWGKK